MIKKSRSRKRKHRSFPIDLSIVPFNVFSLRGEPFYQFIQEITSADVKDLLKIQKISTAQCFLNTNPFDFLNISSDDPWIIELQDRLSFKLVNGNHVVLAGIDGDVHYLTELLSMYSVEINKEITESGSNRSIETSKEADESTTTTLPTGSVSLPLILSIEEHRHYINEQIKSWWEKNRQKLQCENYPIVDDRDYRLIINANSASIMCSCGIQINLSCPKDRCYYQLSNFYKHLINNRKCKTIREQRISSRPRLEINDDDHPDCLSCPSSPTTPTKEVRESRSTSIQNYHHQMEQSTGGSSLRSKRKRI